MLTIEMNILMITFLYCITLHHYQEYSRDDDDDDERRKIKH